VQTAAWLARNRREETADEVARTDLARVSGEFGAFATLLDWAEQINSLYARGLSGAMDLARAIASAKGALLRSQWTQLWGSRRLPFSKRKGEMLAVIGAKLDWLNAQTFAHFPAVC